MNINEVRKLAEIKMILEDCEGFGRTWGTKGSFFHGSHITFIQEEAIVIVYQGKKKDSKLCIANFVKENLSGDGCALKNKIIAVLAEYNIFLKEV